jgi:hypothetical protein
VQQGGIGRPVAEHHLAIAEQRPHRARRQVSPAWPDGLAGEASGIHAQQPRPGFGDAFQRIGGMQHRQHGFLDALGNARGGAAGGQHGFGPGLHFGRPGAGGADHRGHMVGDHLAMHARRRLQHLEQLRAFRQEAGMRAQIGGDLVAVGVAVLGVGWRIGVHRLIRIHCSVCCKKSLPNPKLP